MYQAKIMIAVASLLLLSGCAGSSHHDVTSAEPLEQEVGTQVLPGQLPPLPLDKESSAAYFLNVNGKNTFDRSANATDSFPNLQLDSTADELSWGIWEFSPGLEFLVSIKVMIDIPAGEKAYAALSNYADGLWEIMEPMLESGSYTFPVDADYRSAAGNFYIAVVTAGGESATVEKLTLATDNGWVIVTVDEGGTTFQYGNYSSLAVINGRPAISYFDRKFWNLKYAGCFTPTGANANDWWVMLVDSEGSIGGSGTSLAAVGGQPAIAYTDATSAHLKYARRDDSMIYWEIVTVDSGKVLPWVGYHPSLAVVADRPYISYLDNAGVLLYALASTITGASADDWNSFIIDNQDVGTINSIVDLGGAAAVSYHNGSNSDLIFKWFSNPAKTIVDSVGQVGFGNSLAVVDGRPAIAYSDQTNQDIKYAISDTSSGANASDWIKVVVDGTDDLGAIVSMAIIDGRPAIAYPDETDSSLNLAWSKTATGATSDAWEIVTVYLGDTTGTQLSLIEVDGKPAISFQIEARHLMYAIRMGP